jgi:capsular polysaccharide biosynthesis protein
MELKAYLSILRKRIWLIAAMIAVSVGAAWFSSYLIMEPVYQASTKLIVNKSEEPGVIQQMDFNTLNANLKLIDTYKEIIKTPRIMEIVEKRNPEFGLTSEALIRKVNVSSVNNTQVMTLTVKDPSYEKAANIINAVSEVFQAEIPLIMKVDNVSILNKADPTKHPKPVEPNPMLNILLAFMVSSMIAASIVFLLEYLDDTLKTEEDIAQVLQLPTLAVISRVKETDLGLLSIAKTKAKAKTNKAKAGETPYATFDV